MKQDIEQIKLSVGDLTDDQIASMGEYFAAGAMQAILEGMIKRFGDGEFSDGIREVLTEAHSRAYAAGLRTARAIANNKLQPQIKKDALQ